MTDNLDPKGYYSTLGVDPSASEDEIRTAYRKYALKWHSDRNQKNFTEEKGEKYYDSQFNKGKEAYEHIGNRANRQAYDFMSGNKENWGNYSNTNQSTGTNDQQTTEQETGNQYSQAKQKTQSRREQWNDFKKRAKNKASSTWEASEGFRNKSKERFYSAKEKFHQTKEKYNNSEGKWYHHSTWKQKANKAGKNFANGVKRETSYAWNMATLSFGKHNTEPEPAYAGTDQGAFYMTNGPAKTIEQVYERENSARKNIADRLKNSREKRERRTDRRDPSIDPRKQDSLEDQINIIGGVVTVAAAAAGGYFLGPEVGEYIQQATEWAGENIVTLVDNVNPAIYKLAGIKTAALGAGFLAYLGVKEFVEDTVEKYQLKTLFGTHESRK